MWASIKAHPVKFVLIAVAIIVVGGLLGLPTGYAWAKRKFTPAAK